MKKIFLLIGILLLTGCTNNKSSIVTTDEYQFNNNYYSVYQPYKVGIADNYIVSKIDNSYDLEEVETGLMRVSLEYFDNNRYYLQAGQYINKSEIIKLLDKEHLNKTDIKVVNEQTVDPLLISYIVEHNYLNNDGKLNGIAIGLVINPYQLVTGTNNYVTINEDDLKLFIEEKSNELITYLRSKSTLKGIDIVIGIYYQTPEDSFISGSYKYVGFTASNSIKDFKNLNQSYYLFPSDEIQLKDSNAYSKFNALLMAAKKVSSNASIIGRGLYVDDQLQKLNIDVNLSYYNKDTLIAISEVIATAIGDYNAQVSVEINQLNDTKVMIIKNKNENKVQIYFVD